MFSATEGSALRYIFCNTCKAVSVPKPLVRVCVRATNREKNTD